MHSPSAVTSDPTRTAATASGMQTIIDTFDARTDAIQKLAQFCAFALCIRAWLRRREKFFDAIVAVEASVRPTIEGSG